MIRFNQEYYEKVVNQNGYKFCANLEMPLPGLSVSEMQKWLCVYNLPSNLVTNLDPKDTLFIAGVGVNREPHIGTISQLLRMLYLQKKGYNVQIILGDLDCYNARGTDLESIRAIVEKYNAFLDALGFDHNLGVIRNQLDHEEVMKTAFLIAPKISDNDFYDVQEDLYTYYKKKGILTEEITFPVKQSILMMFADFIHNGFTSQFKHIIVLSGIDEHTYVPKAAEIARRMNIDMTLSGMFSKLIAGFNNQPKMSKSLPDSSIWVTMSFSEILDMLLNHDNGYTDYNDSIVFQLMSSTFIYSDEELQKMAEHCTENSDEWVKDKIDFSKKLFELCRIWQNA